MPSDRPEVGILGVVSVGTRVRVLEVVAAPLDDTCEVSEDVEF